MADVAEMLPWMPDLCRLRRIGALLGLAELVVLVLALVPDGDRGWSLMRFCAGSGLALWLALVVAALLCLSRRWLSALPWPLGGPLAVLIAGVIALLGAGSVHALYDALGRVPALAGASLWRFSGGCALVAMLITALALRHFHLSDRALAQLRAVARAEADALQARIRPHFLFNSMNLIAALLREEPALAEQAVLDLSDLFRAALGAGDGDSTLAAECELAERYLAIESLRLGARLRVHWCRQEPLPWQLRLPPLLLQPLLENAVLHGIARLADGGQIEIDLRCVQQCLLIRIANPVPPAAAAALPAGGGHALASIGHRLRYRFGAAARMTAGRDGDYYVCQIAVPLRSGDIGEGGDRGR